MTDTQGCGWDGVHWSIDQLVADGSANARHELARRLRSVLARMQGGPPVSNDDKTALPAFPWDARRPESKFSAYYFFLESTGDPGVDSVLMAVAFAGKMSHSTEQWGDTDVSGRTLGGWIQHAAELAAAAHRAEVERLRSDAEDLRERLAEAKLLLTDGVAMVGRLRAGLRDAFDAGARAAVAEIHGGDDLPANMDITKLPGRPEVRP